MLIIKRCLDIAYRVSIDSLFIKLSKGNNDEGKPSWMVYKVRWERTKRAGWSVNQVWSASGMALGFSARDVVNHHWDKLG